MQDIKISPNIAGSYDIVFDGADLAGVDGIETSIAVSLWTDKRCDPTDIRDPQRRRGCVGELLRSHEYGSLFWLLDQARNTQERLNKAVLYFKESLKWLIDDGVFDDVIVNGEQTLSGMRFYFKFIKDSAVVSRYSMLVNDTRLSNIIYEG